MSEPLIHPAAIVSSEAKLAVDVRVGPYAVIEGPCEIGAGVEIGPHSVIQKWVRLGEGVKVGAHCLLGCTPSDLSFKDQETWLEVGSHTILREGAALERSTNPARPTKVGANCYLMGYIRLGHDCQLGDGVIVIQNSAIGGHVELHDYVTVGALVMIHQFVRVGTLAMIGAGSKVNRDILPYSLADGQRAPHFSLNKVGLRRAGIVGERYKAVEQAFRAVHEGKPLDAPDTIETRIFQAFLTGPSKRGLAGFVGKGEATSNE